MSILGSKVATSLRMRNQTAFLELHRLSCWLSELEHSAFPLVTPQKLKWQPLGDRVICELHISVYRRLRARQITRNDQTVENFVGNNFSYGEIGP